MYNKKNYLVKCTHALQFDPNFKTINLIYLIKKMHIYDNSKPTKKKRRSEKGIKKIKGLTLDRRTSTRKVLRSSTKLPILNLTWRNPPLNAPSSPQNLPVLLLCKSPRASFLLWYTASHFFALFSRTQKINTKSVTFLYSKLWVTTSVNILSSNK